MGATQAIQTYYDEEFTFDNIVAYAGAGGALLANGTQRMGTGLPVIDDVAWTTTGAGDQYTIAWTHAGCPANNCDGRVCIECTEANDSCEIAVDVNNDDFASYAELSAAYPGLTEAEFEQIDGNNDNRVSSDEIYAPEAQQIVSLYEGEELPRFVIDL